MGLNDYKLAAIASEAVRSVQRLVLVHLNDITAPPAAHKVQPTSGTAGAILHCNRQVGFCTSITVWFGSAAKQDQRRLHRTIRPAEKINGTELPNIQEQAWSQETARGNLCRLLTPWALPIQSGKPCCAEGCIC